MQERWEMLIKVYLGNVKRPPARLGQWWEDNVGTGVEEVKCKGVDWIEVARGRVQWQACVNTVMKVPIALIHASTVM